MKCSIRTVLTAVSCQLSALPLTACPLCKDAISKVSGLARGFNWSILLMLTAIVIVVGVISGVLIKANRRAGSSDH
jgi:heme/copper-type cytochrome/quinol oxidase subunit 2